MMDANVERKYRDAFYRRRPEHGRCDEFSLRHPKMPSDQRAKIFSPFAALRGFEEAIDSKRRLYVEKRELNEEEQAALNQMLAYLHERTKNLRMARENQIMAAVLCYFPCADENHEAYGCRGSYENVIGPVWKVDPLLTETLHIGNRVLELTDIAEIKLIEDA